MSAKLYVSHQANNIFTLVSVEKLETDFIIPELPFGKILTINILSTWGDKHYVGLNGVEIFSEFGKPVNVQKVKFPFLFLPNRFLLI